MASTMTWQDRKTPECLVYCPFLSLVREETFFAALPMASSGFLHGIVKALAASAAPWCDGVPVLGHRPWYVRRVTASFLLLVWLPVLRTFSPS